MQIVDNFLPALFFKSLNNLFEHGHKQSNNKFDWYWNSGYRVTAKESYPYRNKTIDSNFMFTHVLWDIQSGKPSPYFEIFEPIIYFIDKYSPVKNLFRMKLNLYTNQNKKILHTKHIDVVGEKEKPLPNITVCTFNFTDCNGGVIIDNIEYPSKANQALIFDNKLEHQGYVQTDTPRRIMLNIDTFNS